MIGFTIRGSGDVLNVEATAIVAISGATGEDTEDDPSVSVLYLSSGAEFVVRGSVGESTAKRARELR